jgi:quercetin dioxygenase-like cupin family protein
MNDKKRSTNGDVHELVSAFALGALDADEKSRFEDHLDECASCQAELRSLKEVTSSMVSSHAAEPPVHLRERLMERAHGSRQLPGLVFEQSGILVSRSADIPWQTMGPGIRVKLLYADAARKYRTMLVRMDAGAYMPKHHHKEIEELFILSGELHVQGQIARAGDYCRADAETVHEAAFTPSGAMFLAIACEQDEFIL